MTIENHGFMKDILNIVNCYRDIVLFISSNSLENYLLHIALVCYFGKVCTLHF